MKELDLLKKDWQKSEGSFEQLSEKDIYAMIHKKSSSIVKWILIVSILEFVILNGIGLLLPEDHSNEFNDKFVLYLNILTIISYGTTIYFVFLFFKNYKSISVISSTKELAESILKTRKTVKYYIWYNITYVALEMIAIIIYLIDSKTTRENDDLGVTIFIIIILLVFVIGLVWGFYQLIYGFLLKKLKRNYEELQKIDL
ncbi:MAG: hypothetical protein RL311_1480 [Bacteroidota bacterium]|jgi:hypothetical protein